MKRLTEVEFKRLVSEFIMPEVKSELAAHERRCHHSSRFEVDYDHHCLRSDILDEQGRAYVPAPPLAPARVLLMHEVSAAARARISAGQRKQRHARERAEAYRAEREETP